MSIEIHSHVTVSQTRIDQNRPAEESSCHVTAKSSVCGRMVQYFVNSIPNSSPKREFPTLHSSPLGSCD